jgi:hypothetical protein
MENRSQRFPALMWVAALMVAAATFPVPAGAWNAAALAPSPQLSSTDQPFYVSPGGSDANPGTETEPWKTMAKAAATLQAGQTAIFEDGTYVETATTRFVNGGAAGAPITVKARNRFGAKLYYQGLADQSKLKVSGRPYVTIQGFDITQDRRGTTWADKLVECWAGADHCTVVGNRIHGAMQTFKTWNSAHVVLRGNILYDTEIGAGAFNAQSPSFRRNHIRGFTMDGIQTKGGTRDARVVGNYVHTAATGGTVSGITLGGSSCGSTDTASCGVYDSSGYEGYKNVAWNNVVVSEVVGGLPIGLLIQGCDGCGFFNNVVIGAQNGLETRKGPGLATGWDWDVLTNNPRFENNIVVDCVYDATKFRDVQGTVVSDYNLYSNCPDPPAEAHGVVGDPRFVDKSRDWHLQPDSPAIGRGTVVSFVGFNGVAIRVIAVDRDGATRQVPWNIGAY